MDVLFFIFSCLVFLIGLAVFTNRTRARHLTSFELTPNCLLTRWPLVFITGTRSLFYFSSYWNQYPRFLAEHGYEVFTLHLPWQSLYHREKRFQQFLEEYKKHHRHFHLFMDHPTFLELEKTLRHEKSDVVQSVTILADDLPVQTDLSKMTPTPFPCDEIHFPQHGKTPHLLKWSYNLHRQWMTKNRVPAPHTLGFASEHLEENGSLLLKRAQTLGEMDLHQNL